MAIRKTLVARIQKLMGTNLKPIIQGKAKGEIRNQKLSAAKARRLLGWRPTYSLDAALRETIDWYGAFSRKS